MATTTNFGWETPDDTDLVKDGALAMRTLGNGIDTSFVDLKGGTTGQVLSKTSNTDLDFTWVTSDDANAIQNAIVDAKGDLIAASAADTPARLAVGNNGETLVADSSTSTGLRWQSAANGNFCINGGFDFWQRGTSSSTNAVYLADRWYQVASGTTTHSQQTDVPTGVGVQYSVKWLTGAASSYGQWFQALESALVKTLRSQVVTISGYFKTAGSYSGTLAFRSRYSNSTDALTSIATNITGASVSFNGSDVTSWTRQSYTFTVPSDAVGLTIELVPSAAQASGVSVLMTGVQMELGSTPTAFKRAGGTLAGELAACQRYFQQLVTGTKFIGIGGYYSASYLFVGVHLPVEMRTSPTATVASGTNYYKANSAAGGDNTNSLTIENASPRQVQFYNNSEASGTAGQALYFFGDSASASIGLSAEL
jgi:hypothetical protein